MIQLLMRKVAKSQFNAVLEFSGRLDVDRLKEAVDVSLQIEHVLASRFVDHWHRPYWERITPAQASAAFRTIDAVLPEQQIHDFLFSTIDPMTGPQVRVVLLRGAQDTLLVKLNHLSGDGPAFKNYLRWLIRLYNQDEEISAAPETDPATPYTRYDRSLKRIARRLPLSHKYRIVQRFFSDRTPPLSWKLEEDQVGGSRRCYLLAALSEDQTRKLLEYGRSRQAALTVLLQAAVYRSLRALAEPAGNEVKLGLTADLRWFLRDRKPHPGTGCTTPMANLSGPSKSVLDATRELSFDAAVEELREQFDDIKQQQMIGVEYAPLLMEFPGVRWLSWLLPFHLMKRAFDRRFEQLRTSGGRHFSIANLGEWEADELTPHGMDLAGLTITGPVYELLGMAVFAYTFDGCLCLQLGFAETLMDQELGMELLDRLADELIQGSGQSVRPSPRPRIWVA